MILGFAEEIPPERKAAAEEATAADTSRGMTGLAADEEGMEKMPTPPVSVTVTGSTILVRRAPALPADTDGTVTHAASTQAMDAVVPYRPRP